MMIISSHIGVLLIAITLLNYVSSIDIECEFSHEDFDNFYNKYTCSVQNSIINTEKNTEIGVYLAYSNNLDHVFGFSVRSKTMNFFPTNLSEKFKNLIAIRIRECKLKEIHQNDLKPFINLRYLNLDLNPIEILEEGLFDFNLHLEVIWFENNEIRSIGQTTFDKLNVLRDLDLSANKCVSKRVSSRIGMLSFLTSLKTSCFTPESTTTTMATTVTTPKYSNQNSKSGIIWMIVGISIFCVFSIVNIVVIIKCFRKKTIIVQPIEPEDY